MHNDDDDDSDDLRRVELWMGTHIRMILTSLSHSYIFPNECFQNLHNKEKNCHLKISDRDILKGIKFLKT